MSEMLTPDPFRFKVGAFNCVIVTDGISVSPEDEIAGIFKGNGQIMAAYRALTEPLAMSTNILVIEADGQRILVDTGLGGLDPDNTGFLPTNLRAAEIEPESIDVVVLTHFHLDHLGGLLTKDGAATFPNARLIVPRDEYAHWMSEAILAGMDEFRRNRLHETFAAYPDLLQVDDNAEIATGVCYIPAQGHTPGHCGVRLESQGETLVHLVDTCHLTIQLNALDVSPSFDVQPDRAVATRQKLIAQSEAANLLTLFYHFPYPGLGYLRTVSGQREWVPY